MPIKFIDVGAAPCGLGGDSLRKAFIKINDNFALLAQTAGGTPTVAAPTSLSDSSMFSGGVFPSTGSFLAMDINWIYSYNAAVDDEWQQTPRSN